MYRNKYCKYFANKIASVILVTYCRKRKIADIINLEALGAAALL
jgi:hypothetical protein